MKRVAAALILFVPVTAAVAQTPPGQSRSEQTAQRDMPPPRASESFATRPGPYLRGNLGYSFGEDPVDESWTLGAGIGWRFSPSFRLEGAFDYRPDYNQKTNFGFGPGPKTGLTNWTAMANAYYDFNVEPLRPLVPYLGGGIGMARNSVDDVDVIVPGTGVARITGSDRNQFAWQAMGGLSYYLSDTTALDFGYRYLDAGHSGLGGNLQAHEIVGAVRFGF